MVDIARDPRWGRITEGSGEDPFLGSVMAVARVRGFQGQNLRDPTSIAATAKHFAAYGGVWPVHCVQNTKGAEFHPALRDDPRIVVISKGLGDTDCYSAFDETDLLAQLRQQNVEEVVVGGLATDYCVKSTVLDALKNGFKVKALENAMRAVDVQPGDGERAIEEMRNAGAQIVEDKSRAAGAENRSRSM
jgi:nicotinamidase-related amidase